MNIAVSAETTFFAHLDHMSYVGMTEICLDDSVVLGAKSAQNRQNPWLLSPTSSVTNQAFVLRPRAGPAQISTCVVSILERQLRPQRKYAPLVSVMIDDALSGMLFPTCDASLRTLRNLGSLRS